MATELVVVPHDVAVLDVQSAAPVQWDEGEYVAVVEREAPRYVGPYEVTPSAAAQTLDTAWLVMTGNLTVAPIPSNYGLVTWDGATLTVS